MNIGDTILEMANDKDCLPPECYVSRHELLHLLLVAQGAKMLLAAENSLSSDAIGIRDEIEKALSIVESDKP